MRKHRRSTTCIRRLWLVIIALICSLGVHPALAQQTSAATPAPPVIILLSPGQSEDDINRALRAATAGGHPTTLQWAPAASAQPADGQPDSATPVAADAMVQQDPVAMQIDGLATAFSRGAATGLQGIRRVSDLPAEINARLPATTSWARVIASALLILIAGLACTWLVRRLMLRLLVRPLPAGADILSRSRVAALHFVADLLALAAFLVVGHFAVNALFPAPDVGRALMTTSQHVIALIAFYVMIGRLLLSPGDPALRLVPIAHSGWHMKMLVAYGSIAAIVSQTVELADWESHDPLAVEGWFLVGATGLAILKLFWFWHGRHAISAVFAGPAPGHARRVTAHLLPWLLMLSVVLIWIVGFMAVGKPGAAQWGVAGGATQLVVLAIPILAIGLHSFVEAGFARWRLDESRFTPFGHAVSTSLQTLLTGGVWLFGLFVIMQLWSFYLSDLQATAALFLLEVLLRVSIATVVGWTIWRFLRSYFGLLAPAYHPVLPGETEVAAASSGRMSTILPLIRDVAFAAVIAVTALVILSSLGMNVTPLLAGFGVFGLAVSFGSQSLVKDIVAGVFFIAEDAFRIGEYLDTGKLKGTVERITLRSVQLRHQNGQIHTIPFGQLAAVTNFSRDWSTIKFELRFDRDVDIERVRKEVKKVGLAMLEDAEFGAEFLVPLKLQGIQDITDNSMVVRLKFTVKPGNPSLIQREAMKRLIFAFREAGLPLASNAVTVRSNVADAAAAAVAQSATDHAPAAQPASE